MQLNKEVTNKRKTKETDFMTQYMLETYSKLYVKIFFQDLPFLWRENKEHPLFALGFFEDHKGRTGPITAMMMLLPPQFTAPPPPLFAQRKYIRSASFT